VEQIRVDSETQPVFLFFTWLIEPADTREPWWVWPYFM